MRFIKSLPLLVLSLLVSSVTFATTFTVTSNADAGPGSLREALTNAALNGTTDPDVINFNLPGSLTSDRTIRLKTQLPLVTANLIIDGTSQPGIPFGISDARVIMEPETSPAGFTCLIIAGDYTTNNVTKAVEIYGLYIRNFAKITSLSNYDSNQGSGIYIQGSSSGIKIGAPGKGNVICGNIYAIYNLNTYYYTTSSDISIQSNIIGLADDGKTAIPNINGISASYFNGVTIGGDDPKMGNVISANVYNVSIVNNYYYYAIAEAIKIKNNKIGTDYTGTIDYKQNPLFVNSAFLKTYGVNVVGYSGATNMVDISANLISGQTGYGIFISSATYNIKNNKIGTDVTGTKNLANYEGIRSDISAKGTIGGPDDADKNYIGFNTFGIEVLNSSQVLINQNSIFCNTNSGIVISAGYAVPYVQLLTFKSDVVSGLATPNCAIELFYSDDCGGTVCQGKTYITTVQSDASGKWSYSGSITGTVVATATNSAKNTSQFSSLGLLPNEAVTKQYTCAYMGSITIPQVRDGILFHWDKRQEDGTLTPLADTQNIDNLDPGIYDLTIQYPGGCQKVSQLFEIKDQRIKIQNLIPPVPQCRQKSFPVNVNYSGGTGNVQFKWVDDKGVTGGTGKNPNIAAGTYTLHITDDAGCDVTSDPITIVAKPGPDYDASRLLRNSAQCGVANGSITGMKATAGIGPLTYSWKTYPEGVEVGTSLDLVNISGDHYYTLTLSDQSGNDCTPYTAGPYYVAQTNSVFIGNALTISPTCDLNNGSINLPLSSITNASQFRWYGPNGAELVAYRDKLILTNLADGNYTLVATNPVTGCNNSKTFQVIRIPKDVFSYNVNPVPTTCERNNGSISVTFGGVAPVTYKWTNESGATVGFTPNISGLAPGTYYLAVTDSHNCSTPLLLQGKVEKTPLLAWDATSEAQITPDVCTQYFGAVTGLKVTGGVPPYVYTWKDANGKVVGTNSAVLTNVPAGKYKLHVADQTTCEVLDTNPFEVLELEPVQTPPTLANQKICDPGQVTFTVQRPQHGLFKLYKNAGDASPALTSVSGVFTLNVEESSDFYVSYNVGSCESARTPVHVEVLRVDVKFKNTITPNGDGINDYWKISGLEKFPGALVQIFTRQGQKVYESKDYAIPFNGTSRGTALLAGSYYYIIDLHIDCKLISGNLTIVK